MQQQFAWPWVDLVGPIQTGSRREFVAAMAEALGRWIDRPWKIYILDNSGLAEVRLYHMFSSVANGVTTDTYSVRPLYGGEENLLQFVVVRQSDARSSRVD